MANKQELSVALEPATNAKPEGTKPDLIVAADTATTTTIATTTDPFDLDSLRLSQNFVETAGVKKLLRTVPVRRPNPQDFVRVRRFREARRRRNRQMGQGGQVLRREAGVTS